MKKIIFSLLGIFLWVSASCIYAEETWKNNKYQWEERIPDKQNVVKIAGGDINGDMIADVVAIYNKGSKNAMVALVSSGEGYKMVPFDDLSADIIGHNELAKVKNITIEDNTVIALLDFNINTLVNELSGTTPAILKFRYLEDKIKLVELTSTGKRENGRIAHLFYNVLEGQIYYHYLGEDEKVGDAPHFYFHNYSRVIAPKIGKPFPVDCDLNKWVMVARPQKIKNSAVGDVVTWGFEKWRSDYDLSGKFYMAYQGNDIYLLVNVTDDIFRQNFAGDQSLRGDHLEIWFADKNGRKYQICLNPGNFAAIAPEAMLWYDGQKSVTHRTLKGVRIASERTNKGYVVEAKIPVSVFQMTDIKQLTKFSVALSDSDAADKQEKVMASSCLIWSDDWSLGEVVWK